MPTLFIYLGIRFEFFANDHEPIHVHVSKGGREAKINITTMEVEGNWGFSPSELKHAVKGAKENREVIIERWNEFFKK